MTIHYITDEKINSIVKDVWGDSYEENLDKMFFNEISMDTMIGRECIQVIIYLLKRDMEFIFNSYLDIYGEIDPDWLEKHVSERLSKLKFFDE